MLYLGTSPNEEAVRTLLDARRIGLMTQPASNPPRVGWIYAADNGCFSTNAWDEARWQRWVHNEHLPRPGCLFATVPDVVGDHAATVDRFHAHIAGMPSRFPTAFVGQDGAQPETTPWDRFDALFVGGSTEWKMSEHAFGLASSARQRGKWVHVGRVNSSARFQAWAPFADSCDGTFLAFGPAKNAQRLMRWIERHHREPKLWEAE